MGTATRKPKLVTAPQKSKRLITTGNKTKGRVNNPLTKLVNLLPKEVQHLSKPREGFVEFAEPMIAVYEAHADTIRLKDTTPAGARAVLAAYLELVQMEKAAQKHLEMIQATRALRASNVWDIECGIYAHASVAGREDVQMERDVGPFAKFLANGPRKSVAEPPEETTPSGSTTPAVATPVVTAALPTTK